MVSVVPAHISVPIEMIITAKETSLGKKLQVFLLLKLMYRHGKSRLTEDDLRFIQLTEQISSFKTIKNYIRFFLRERWISYNFKTGYYILRSFDHIRKEKGWNSRAAFPVDFDSYQKLEAITGAIIFGYLYKNYWRKLRRRKSVLYKGSTFNFPAPQYPHKKKGLAPVSVLGVNQLFALSASTASRIKRAAQKEGYLFIKKNFLPVIPYPGMLERCLKYNDKRKNLVYHEGKLCLQLIDTVFPHFQFTRRQSLKT